MATGAVVARILSQYSDKGSKAAQRDIQKLGKKIDAFGKKATKSFAVAGIATAAYAAKLAVDSVKGAAADEKALTALDVALRNNTNATDAAIAANANFLDALELQVAIDNEQLIPALQTLATATGDLTQAQALLSLSTDVSAASGKDLGAVSVALSKAVNGNFTALKKLGLPLDEDAIKAKDLGAILVQLSKISEGQAAAAANTFAGKLEKLRLSINQVKDRLGIALMPGLIVLATYIQDKIVPQLEYFIYLNQYKISSALESTVKNIKDTAHAFGNIYAVIAAINEILPFGIGGYIQIGAAIFGLTKIIGFATKAWKIYTAVGLANSIRVATEAGKSTTELIEKFAKFSPVVGASAEAFTRFSLGVAKSFEKLKSLPTMMQLVTGATMGTTTAVQLLNGAILRLKATVTGIVAFLARYVKQLKIILVVMGLIAGAFAIFDKDKAKLSPEAAAIEWNIYKTTVLKGIQSMDQARDAAIKKQEEQNSKTKEQIEQEKIFAAMEAKNAKEAAKNARAVALREAVLARLKKLNAVPGTGKAKIGKGITPVSTLDPAEYEAINFRAAELLLLKQKDNEVELKKLAALKENILLQEIRNTLSLRYVDILRVIADEKITDAEVKALAMGWKLPEQAVRAYLIQFQAVADGTISDDEVVQLAKSWGSTKDQAAKYLDFFSYLNDGILSDAEIEKLKSKWGMTEDQVRQYADFVGVVNDGKLTDSEIVKLTTKWKMTTDEVVAYILKIGSPVSYSGTLIDPATAATIGWKNAKDALEAYLRLLGQGSTTGSKGGYTYDPAASVDANKEAADAAAAAADAAAAESAANSAATEAALAAANKVIALVTTIDLKKASGRSYLTDAEMDQVLSASNSPYAPNASAGFDDERSKFITKYGLSPTIANASNMGTGSSNSGVTVNLTVNGSVSTEQDLVSAVRNGLLATQTNGNTLTLQAV